MVRNTWFIAANSGSSSTYKGKGTWNTHTWLKKIDSDEAIVSLDGKNQRRSTSWFGYGHNKATCKGGPTRTEFSQQKEARRGGIPRTRMLIPRKELEEVPQPRQQQGLVVRARGMPIMNPTPSQSTQGTPPLHSSTLVPILRWRPRGSKNKNTSASQNTTTWMVYT